MSLVGYHVSFNRRDRNITVIKELYTIDELSGKAHHCYPSILIICLTLVSTSSSAPSLSTPIPVLPE